MCSSDLGGRTADQHRAILTADERTAQADAGGREPRQETERQSLLHRNLQRKKNTPKRFANTSSRRLEEAIPSRWHSAVKPGRACLRLTPRVHGTHTWRCSATARVCASGKLTPEDRSSPTQKLNRGGNRRVVPVAPVARGTGRRRGSIPSAPLRSRFRGSCRSGGRRAWLESRRFRPGRSGSAAFACFTG